jgi:chaperonin GroEL (HSP60 family)
VQQISLFDADKRGKFFEGLSEKRINLILSAIELEKQEQSLFQEVQDGLSLDIIVEELSKILSKKPSAIAVNPTIGKEMRTR